MSPAGLRAGRGLALLLASVAAVSGAALDLAPSAHRRVGNAGRAIELEWDEERDIEAIQIGFAGLAAHASAVEYWFKNWPYHPPEMPSMEDPLDDRWQGRWLKAETKESCEGQICRYTFEPLHARENVRANNLPGTVYRRTLKIRISYEQPQTQIRWLQAFSSTGVRVHRLSVEAGVMPASFSVYNGQLRSVRASPSDRKTFELEVLAADKELPGSNDDTVVTVHAKESSFSFRVKDLADGAMSIPARQARVLDLDSQGERKMARRTIRSRIELEPEQTYERAAAEIPALDPVDREWGGPLYLPLAADASWQKFAFEIGGNVYLSKDGLKAKPEERKRLNWRGDRLTWAISTGENARHAGAEKVRMRPKEGYLPVVTQSWTADGLAWQEEAFVTLLRGPLAPDDPARNEETPAVLLLRLTARNTGPVAKQATAWLETGPGDVLRLSGGRLFAGNTLRATVSGAVGAAAPLPGSHDRGALKFSFEIGPGGSRAIVLKLPAVTDLSDDDARAIEALDYEGQRGRVEAYWRALIGKAARISVPEAVFNDFLRATVAHIHITATKDPGSGLVMLGAASYVYDVYENEACYQVLLLDAMGESAEAAKLLEPMLALQGSKNFPGAQTGSYAGVFHGIRISGAVDYTANGYGLDHGTVLWTLAQHYLYTRDRNWFRRAWPHMQLAIAWIEEQRKSTEARAENGARVREYGLLPASKLEDNDDWANWFSINAFGYAGMDLSARILSELGYREAASVRAQADAYRSDLRQAVLRAVEAAPVVGLQDGTYEPYVPTTPTRRFRLFGPERMDYYARYGGPALKPLLRLGADRDTLCGSVLLLILGVFEAHEPIADWILNDWEDNETLSSGMGMNIHGMTDDARWFSQGGMVFQANLINPIPVYLKRHEIPAAIRNLYNDFVSGFYPGAMAFSEEFHQWVHASGPFYKSSDEARFVNRLRDLLVMEDRDTLWLAAGVPRRWLESRDGIRVSDAPTFFGSVSYSLHAGSKERTIEGVVRLPMRNPAVHSWLVVRAPSRQLRSVRVNGRVWTRVDWGREAIELTGVGGVVAVEVGY